MDNFPGITLLERDRKTRRCHAHQVSPPVVGDEDQSREPEGQVPLSLAASDFKGARRLVTAIDGEIEVPGGVRALTSHSSGRGGQCGCRHQWCRHTSVVGSPPAA
jgi:hypothetical protein